MKKQTGGRVSLPAHYFNPHNNTGYYSSGSPELTNIPDSAYGPSFPTSHGVSIPDHLMGPDLGPYPNPTTQQTGGYSYIVNPKTGKNVLVTGRLGKSILKQYLNQLGGSYKNRILSFLGFDTSHKDTSPEKIAWYKAVEEVNEAEQKLNVIERNINRSRKTPAQLTEKEQLALNAARNELRIRKAVNKERRKDWLASKRKERRLKEGRESLARQMDYTRKKPILINEQREMNIPDPPPQMPIDPVE